MESHHRCALIGVALAGVLAVAGAAQAFAATITVCPSGCEYTSIQAALPLVGVKDVTIRIGPGTYAGDLELVKDITLAGAGAGRTTIEGIPDGGAAVIYIKLGISVAISGVTIAGGATHTYSGGVNNFGKLTLLDSVIRGNSGSFGGGIFTYADATSTLIGCEVTGNTAETGGGIWNGNIRNAEPGRSTLIDSTVSSNSATEESGGGIWNEGVLTLFNSTVSGNETVHGGGLYDGPAGTAALSFSRVTSNSASDGGGLYDEGAVTLKDTSLDSNEATDGGGAYVGSRGTLTLRQAGVVADSAGEGGGVFNTGEVTGSGSVIADNSAKEGVSIFEEGGTDTLKDSFVEP
jgi:hypothetical protein